MSQIEYLLNSQGIDYYLNLRLYDDSFKIIIELSEESKYWEGNFSKDNIEENTFTAGSYKTYSTFIKMLNSGLMKETSSIYLDIVDSNEIQMNPLVNIKKNHDYFQSKGDFKYLIVNFVSEFENSFYPLQLNYLPYPEMSILNRTIDRLRNHQTKIFENLLQKSHNKKICVCCKENDLLRREIISLKEQIIYINQQISQTDCVYKKGKIIHDLTELDTEHRKNMSLFMTKENQLVETSKKYENKIHELNRLRELEKSQFNNFLNIKNNEIKSLQQDVSSYKQKILKESASVKDSSGEIEEKESNNTFYKPIMKKSISNSVINCIKSNSTSQIMKSSNTNISNRPISINNPLISKKSPNNSLCILNKNKDNNMTNSTNKISNNSIKQISNEEISEKLRKIEKLLKK